MGYCKGSEEQFCMYIVFFGVRFCNYVACKSISDVYLHYKKVYLITVNLQMEKEPNIQMKFWIDNIFVWCVQWILLI